MKNLTTAIYAKKTGSTFETAINSRLYKVIAPENPTFPYAVFKVIDDTPEHTYSESYENVLIQFSLYSSTSGTTEVEDIFTKLCALYDECSLSITGETLVHMQRQSAYLISEEHTTINGLQKIWHYPVEYFLLVQRN